MATNQSASLHKERKRAVIPASELHRSAGKALKRVAVDDQHLIVERDGYPVAALLPYQDYQTLMRRQALELHRQLAVDLSQAAEKQGLTEDQLRAELEEDKKAVYKQTYGQDPE